MAYEYMDSLVGHGQMYTLSVLAEGNPSMLTLRPRTEEAGRAKYHMIGIY